jgi:hypothetical protein
MLKKVNHISKIIRNFRPQIRSRHPSHNGLRLQLSLLPFRSVVRFGSTTESKDNKSRVEINSIQSIKNSSNKLLMKQCFVNAEVKTADWWRCFLDLNIIKFVHEGIENRGTELIENLPYPIVAKHHFGSRGKGNTLIKSIEEFNIWIKSKTLSNYIFERFYNYAHEFRLHVTKDGCFYTCRKALKSDVAEEEKWHFHDDTCVWFMEDNEKFLKPNSWNNIVSDCIKALEAVGGDLLAFDVKVQSPTNNKDKVREYQEYILLECNSAPSFGDVTLQKYIEEIPKILKCKFIENV